MSLDLLGSERSSGRMAPLGMERRPGNAFRAVIATLGRLLSSLAAAERHPGDD
jgi:hypothetical protein